MIKRIKSFHLVLAALLCLLVLAAGTSLIGRTSQECSVDVDMVPIQLIYDVAQPVTTLSAADLKDFSRISDPFNVFVRSVTEHLAAKLAQEQLCLSSAESRDRSLLQFTHWGVATGPRSLTPPLELRAFDVCRISSPWIDLVIERRPVPSIRGVARWNERQLLADQAVLAGARNVPPGVAMPVPYKEFIRYAFEYASSEIYHRPADKPIEERVPADLLWLFRRAGQDPNEDFSGLAGSSTTKAMVTGVEGYTKIVITLIDHCFAAGWADINYSSILDLENLISLEQYKITASLVEMPIQ